MRFPFARYFYIINYLTTTYESLKKIGTPYASNKSGYSDTTVVAHIMRAIETSHRLKKGGA